MIFSTHADYVKEIANAAISDLTAETMLSAEMIPIIESGRDGYDIIHILKVKGYVSRLLALYDKWNANSEMQYDLYRLLAYTLSKNPDCSKDISRAYKKDVGLHNDEIECNAAFRTGLSVAEYRRCRNALAVLKTGKYMDILFNSFMENFKGIYAEVDRDEHYWKKLTALSVSFSFEDIVKIIYFSLKNLKKIQLIQNYRKDLYPDNLNDFMYTARIKQYIGIYARLIDMGALEYANNKVRDEKDLTNKTIDYADRLALETQTMYDIHTCTGIVNNREIDLAATIPGDVETVRELMRRLTIMTIKYRMLYLKYADTIDFVDRKNEKGQQFEVEPEDIWEIYTDVVSS